MQSNIGQVEPSIQWRRTPSSFLRGKVWTHGVGRSGPLPPPAVPTLPASYLFEPQDCLPAQQVPRSSPLDCDVRTEAAQGAFGKIVRRGTRDLAVLLLLTLQLLCPSQMLLFLHLLSLLLLLLLLHLLLPPTVTLLKHCCSIAVLLFREDSDTQQMFSAYSRRHVVEPPLDLFNLLRVAYLFGCSRGCTPRSPTVLCSSRMWPGASHFSPSAITEGLSSSLSWSASRSPRSALSSSCTYRSLVSSSSVFTDRPSFPLSRRVLSINGVTSSTCVSLSTSFSSFSHVSPAAVISPSFSSF